MGGELKMRLFTVTTLLMEGRSEERINHAPRQTDKQTDRTPKHHGSSVYRDNN